MAETATGLGHGVFEAALKSSSPPGLYLQTTRYPLARAEQIEFEEPHSHAVRQFLYFPEQSLLRKRFAAARCAVVVDDEISTGQTLVNLVVALRIKNPSIEHVVLLCLTDFSEGAAEQRLREVPGILSVATVTMLKGAFSFEKDLNYIGRLAARASASMACRRGYTSRYSARLGIGAAIDLPKSLVETCSLIVKKTKRTSSALVEAAPRNPCILVLGTGEFMHPALCLASAFNELGIEAFVQSTTRSPILVGQNIANGIGVPDPYCEGIPNYLYNFNPDDFDGVFVVHETPRNAELLALCKALQAHSVSLLLDDVLTIEAINASS